MQHYYRLFLVIFVLSAITTMTFAQAPQINEVELSATSVDQYGKLEAVVDLTASYDNPYDYDQSHRPGALHSSRW